MQATTAISRAREVVEWDTGTRLTMRVIGTNLPFETPDMRFTVYAENDAFTGFIEEFGILAGQPNQHV